MSSRARLALSLLSLALVAFPLALAKPGLPPNLKADESAYLMMASSLAADGDLRLGPEDVERVFREFPFGPVQNLIVMSDDGWRTVYFGKPWLYSLFGAPFVALFGANGLLLVNALLMAGMVWLGFLHLRRYNDEGLAALFAAAFFLGSAAFAYLFWLQPEVFNMAAVTAGLYLGLHSGVGRDRRGLARAALAGCLLVLAAYNKPVLAAVGLPVGVARLRERRWPELAAWLAGGTLTLGALAGLGTLLTGHPSSYLGVARRAITLCAPGEVPVAPEAPPTAPAEPDEDTAPSNAWAWLFRVPDVRPAALAQNVGYFLWGRHTGLIPYLPFAVVALGLFVAHPRRSAERWALLAALVAVALFFLLFVPLNWHGGGGFIGNRYFVAVYPAFLFLVTRVGAGGLAAGCAAAGFALVPILLTPFGAAVPEPTLQAHARNLPFRLLPLELSLRNVPGYERVELGELRVVGRRDVLLPRGEALWIRGASPVELLLLAERPLAELAVRVETSVPGDRIRLELDGDRHELQATGGAERVVLRPARSPRRRRVGEGEAYVHRLEVRTGSGTPRPWVRRLPPNPCPAFARGDELGESFYLGAALTLLGAPAALEADVFALEWTVAAPPLRVAAGEAFTVPVDVKNTSGADWRAGGAARVKLAYHWRDAGGELLVWDGERTELPLPLARGGAATVALRVVAPERGGRHQLELDAVFEHVAWFSQRHPASLRAVPVEVGEQGDVGEGARP